MREIRNQADLDAGLKDGETDFRIVGDCDLAVSGTAAPTLRASGSSQPRVVASGSSQPRVVAYDSSQPRVEASGSSQPRVEAYGSSQPRVKASGSSQLSAAGAVAVEAKGDAVVVGTEQPALVTGTPAHVTTRTRPSSVEAWCQSYGIPIVEGVITLYKAVRDDYRSEHGTDYTPGSMPVASDWDGGKEECGGGLHFSPRPIMALGFDRDATRFLACPIAIADCRSPQPGDSYQNKLKAKGCCGPTVEVDIDGDVLPARELAAV